MTLDSVPEDVRSEVKDIAVRFVIPWVRMIDNGDKYYVHRAMKIFFTMPGAHQEGLLRHIVDQVPNDRWQKKLSDNTQYLDLMRSIIYYYTGREDLGQPSKRQLGKLVSSYLKSSKFIEAARSKGEEKESFIDMLNAL